MKKFFLVLLLILPLIFSSCNKEMECSPSLPVLFGSVLTPANSFSEGQSVIIDFQVKNVIIPYDVCDRLVSNESHTLLVAYLNDVEDFRDTISTPAIKGGETWSNNISFIVNHTGIYRFEIVPDFFNEVIEDDE